MSQEEKRLKRGEESKEGEESEEGEEGCLDLLGRVCHEDRRGL